MTGAFVPDDPWTAARRFKFCEHPSLELRPRAKVYECARCKRRWPTGILGSMGYFGYLSTMVPFRRGARRRPASK